MIINLVDRRAGGSKQACWVDRNPSLVEALAGHLGLPGWAVNLVLVDDGLMTRLNWENRGFEKVTDVLSFCYLSGADNPGDAQLAAGQRGARADLFLDPEPGNAAGDQVAGEVVLAPTFIGERCAANGWPVELEFPMLVVHGLLHILGWEHEEEDERRAMQDLEQEILAREQLTHAMRPGS